MNFLFRLSTLTLALSVATWPFLLIVGAIMVCAGWIERPTLFSFLKASGALGLFSACLVCLLWRRV